MLKASGYTTDSIISLPAEKLRAEHKVYPFTYILGLLAHGTTIEEILEEYPGLVNDDIHADLLFASKAPADASIGM